MSVEQRILVGVAQGDSDMNEASPLLKMEEKGGVVVVDDNGGEVKEKVKAKGLGSFLLGIDMNKDNGDEEQTLQHVGTKGNGAVNRVEEKDGSNGEVIEADGQDINEETAEKAPWNGKNDEFGVDAGREYSVGDFVWGKIKSHPWWPAQIYDASDASDHAMKLKQEGKLLVAYFGDGTFAWCHPSQLKPFSDKFDELAKQSSSKNFVNAVNAAMDEIGRLVGLKMTCSCIPEEKKSDLDRPYALNGGIKENVLVPDVELHKLPVPWIHQMSDLLNNLKGKARNPGCFTLLDNVMLKGWILSFYRLKGIYHLSAYSEPQLIEGLEDKEDNVQIGNFLNKGPEDEEWTNSSSPRPVSTNVQKTKKKSMAEILEGEKSKEAAARSRKSTHRVRPKRRRVAKLIESSPITEAVDSDIEGDDEEEEDKAEGSGLRFENGDAEAKDSNFKGYVLRERKKSKYLSPPYMIPTLVGKMSDGAHSSLKVPMSPSSDSNVEVSPKPKLDTKMPKLKVSAKDVLSEIKTLKLDPCFSKKTEFFPVVEEFLHLFRSSLFSDCENPDPGGEKAVGSSKKRKSKSDQIMNTDKSETEKDLVVSSKKRKSHQIKSRDESETEKDPVLSGKKRKPDQIKNRDPSETENERSSDVKKENGELGGSSRLMISFGPGCSLPSKEDLISIYSKFGPLDESETKIYYNNFFGFVTFKRISDAESALMSSKDCSPFGSSGSVTFALRPPSPNKKKASSPPIKTAERKAAPYLQENIKAEFEFVQKKIKKMSAMLEKSPDGKLSDKMRLKLETELKRVLEKVSTT